MKHRKNLYVVLREGYIDMDNYAKGYGCLQGHLEVLHHSLEVKILHDYKGEVTIPKEVVDELKAQISHMLKRSEEVGNEPPEIYKLPESFNEVAEYNAGDDEEEDNELSKYMSVPKEVSFAEYDKEVNELEKEIEEGEDRGWYLEYNASDPTCNLPVPEEDEEPSKIFDL